MKKSRGLSTAAVILTALLAISSAFSDVKSDDSGSRIYSDSPEIEKIRYLEGTITETGTKKPVKGAVVEIKNSNRGVGYYKTETDKNGYYRINDFIPQIKYDFEVTAKGYVTYSETTNITSARKDVQIMTESVITGTVTDSSGKPLSDVEIKIRSYYEDYGSESGDPFFVKSDSRGAYRLEKLVPGSYILYFAKAGYISESAQLNRVKTGETFKFNMLMYRPATLSGKVIIEEINAPAVNINITATGRYSYSNVTYRDGSFVLEDLKPGVYTINLSHQGFFEKNAGTIRVNEGEDVKDKQFTVRSKPPEIKISSYRYTFTPGREIEFNLRTLKLDAVKVRIYRVPADVFITGKRDPDTIDPAKSGFKTVTEWDEAVKDFMPYEWMYYSVKVDKPLQAGGYCIEVSGKGNVSAREFFTVTSIGSVIKRSPENITVYVTDLVQNNPVKGITVVLYDQDEKKIKERDYSVEDGIMIDDLPVRVVARGNTDENGIYRASGINAQNLSVLAVAADGSYAICAAGRSDYYRSEKDKFYIYTDRPVYRAGDTVFFKIMAKRMGKKFTPIKKQTIWYSIGKPGESPLAAESVELDEWGTATGSVVVPENSKLGYYTINAGFRQDDMYGNGSFFVEQYRKPEFVVEASPVKEFYINGDTVEFKVDTRYFFGAPVSNALVKYRFYEKKADTDNEYAGDEGNGSYSRIKLEGEKYSDSSGSVVLKVAAGNYAYDRVITLEASVTDRSNVTITTQKSVRIGRGEFYVQIIPEENFFGSTNEKKVTVITLSHAGKPVSVTLDLNLYRYIWKPVERVYIHDSRPYFTKKVTTGSDGKAEFTMPGDLGVDGEFDLTAQGKDSRDNIITGSKVIWIYNSAGGNADSKFRNLELTANRTELAGEGEITCLLKSRYTDSYVLVTVEGRDVYEYRVVKMDKNIVPVKFKIKAGYAPNMFVRAAMQRGRALYTADTEVSIPTEDVRFNITLTPDREKYGPGEKAVIRVRATDQSGKPVMADISLAAVDESIFSIRSDNTPEISSFFYSKISNWVLTSYSYPITLLAGAAKDSALKARENFRDTAFWDGSIRTDSKGEAVVTFTLPDNLTTWRLTARGHDQSGKMGEARKKFLTTQDIVARTGKPRFFVEGDKVWLIGIVNNNTESGIENITTEMRINNTVFPPVQDFRVSLPGYGSASKFYAIDVPSGNDILQMEFRATVQGGKGDAVKYSVPVERRGIAYNISGSGDMENSREITIRPVKGDEDFEFIPEQVVITVNPSPVIQMIRAAKYLSEYEYGCIEQTINRFMPNIVLMNLVENGEYSALVPDKMKGGLESSVNDGIRRIEQFQNYDGSWGWWEGDRGNGYITGFALFALHTAADHGYSITQSVVDSGLAAIERMLQNREIQTNDELSYLLYVYSLFGKWDHNLFRRLAGDEKINPYMAANLLKAATLRIASGGDSYEKQEIVKIIPSLKKKIYETAKYDTIGVYWTAEKGQSWDWAGGNTEITAHVLSALVLSGDTGEYTTKAYVSLSKRFSGDCWVSTKTTGTVLIAMCDYLSVKKTGFTPDGNISFTLNGEKIADFRYNLDSDKSINNLSKTVKIPAGKKSDTWVVTAGGKASGDTTYNATIKGTFVFKPKGLFSFMKSEKRNIRALSNGVFARRDLFFLDRVRDLKQQEYLVPQPVEESSKVVTGDELLVRVRFTAQEDFGFMVLEDYLPSGFEVVKESAYDGEQSCSHVERRDNRMVFFFTGIKKGQEYEVAYIIRAELPGSFIMRPARIGCMYEQSIQGWTLPLVIDVQNAK